MASSSSPWIVETSAETFQRDVIQRSQEVPVVVDFWADWCQPCRMLGPLLEKLADEFAGKFVLVKANSDLLPEAAASFGVEALPTVFGLRDGAIVNSFVGLLAEADLRAWVESLFPGEAELLVAEGTDLQGADPGAAEEKFRAALDLAPDDPAALTALARLLLQQDRLEQSEAVLAKLSVVAPQDAQREMLQAELVLRRQRDEVGSVEECRAAAAAAPGDREAQFRLAEALAAQREFEEAMEIFLALISTDKAQFGQRGREAMVNIFHLLPADSELVGTYRRKLAAALY